MAWRTQRSITQRHTTQVPDRVELRQGLLGWRPQDEVLGVDVRGRLRCDCQTRPDRGARLPQHLLQW
jgi:hypothetical protein